MSDLADRLEGVDGIGPATASTIAEAFDDVDDLRDTVEEIPPGYSPARLSRLDGFGPSRARDVAVSIDESGALRDGDGGEP